MISRTTFLSLIFITVLFHIGALTLLGVIHIPLFIWLFVGFAIVLAYLTSSSQRNIEADKRWNFRQLAKLRGKEDHNGIIDLTRLTVEQKKHLNNGPELM